MIHVDPFFLVVVVVLGMVASAAIGAVVWGRAVRRDALEHKEWILKNTVFKQNFIAELRALEMDARGVLALADDAQDPPGSGREYWSGKLQAFRDVIVKLGGKIYG